jgi:hypothetical protein
MVTPIYNYPNCNNSFELDLDNKTLEAFREFDKAFDYFNKNLRKQLNPLAILFMFNCCPIS